MKKTSYRVLIVEDHQEMLQVLSKFLSERGFEIDEADSGEVALKKINSTKPDLILLDIMMPNMDGFEPQKNSLSVEQLLPLDRWIVVKAEYLQQEIIAAYEQYEFHLVYQKVHNFCAMDLGAFYLDVIKDRQYTTQEDSIARRSAQTALYHIVEAMTRWIAPVLSFTAEELWAFIPGQRSESVFFETWYPFPAEIEDKMDDDYWQQIIKVRLACSKEMEKLRVDKVIGSSLDAEIDLYCDDELLFVLNQKFDFLGFL